MMKMMRHGYNDMLKCQLKDKKKDKKKLRTYETCNDWVALAMYNKTRVLY